MMRRLFGNTLEEQHRFLKYRIWISVIVVVIGLATMYKSFTGSVVIALVSYVWAWTFLKRWFGITTISAILSRNIIIAVLMYGAYLGVGYIIGLFTFMVGVIRYIQIRIVMFSRKEK